MTRREPPRPVKRELRQEANFGCAKCGYPIVTYHHIVPWSDEEHHDPDRMIALCRRCHSEADDGVLKNSELYNLKAQPYLSDVAEHELRFSSTIPTMVFGGFQGILKENEQMVLWRVDGENRAIVHFDNGVIEFSGRFFDETGKLVAEFDRNSWWADVDSAWDMIAKNKKLKFLHESRNIGFGLQYYPDKDLIVGRAKFHVEVGTIDALPDKTKFPNGTVASGNIGVDYDCLVNIYKSEDPVRSAFAFKFE